MNVFVPFILYTAGLYFLNKLITTLWSLFVYQSAGSNYTALWLKIPLFFYQRDAFIQKNSFLKPRWAELLCVVFSLACCSFFPMANFPSLLSSPFFFFLFPFLWLVAPLFLAFLQSFFAHREEKEKAGERSTFLCDFFAEKAVASILGISVISILSFVCEGLSYLAGVPGLVFSYDHYLAIPLFSVLNGFWTLLLFLFIFSGFALLVYAADALTKSVEMFFAQLLLSSVFCYTLCAPLGKAMSALAAPKIPANGVLFFISILLLTLFVAPLLRRYVSLKFSLGLFIICFSFLFLYLVRRYSV